MDVSDKNISVSRIMVHPIEFMKNLQALNHKGNDLQKKTQRKA